MSVQGGGEDTSLILSLPLFFSNIGRTGRGDSCGSLLVTISITNKSASKEIQAEQPRRQKRTPAGCLASQSLSTPGGGMTSPQGSSQESAHHPPRPQRRGVGNRQSHQLWEGTRHNKPNKRHPRVRDWGGVLKNYRSNTCLL